MAGRPSRSRSRRAAAPYDLNNPENWTANQFRKNLEDIGIWTPSNMSKTVLKNMYTENVNRRNAPAINGDAPASASSGHTTVDGEDVLGITPDASGNVANVNLPRDRRVLPVEQRPVAEIAAALIADADLATGPTRHTATPVPSQTHMQGALPAATPVPSPDTHAGGAAGHSGSSLALSTTTTSLEASISRLNSSIELLIQHNTARMIPPTAPSMPGNIATPAAHTLETAFTQLQAPAAHTLETAFTQLHAGNNRPSDVTGHLPTGAYTNYGVSPECLPHLDLVSASLRKQILEGKDVNLAALLIPEYEVTQDRSVTAEGICFNLKSTPDPRLLKKLTISEFITAFGKYKRVMCSRFPGRRPELDAYEAIIIELHNLYGQKCYDYHKLFSARSAEALREHNIKVDWSIKDKMLISTIMSGARTNSCVHCGSVDHRSDFCLSRVQTTLSQLQQKYSRLADSNVNERLNTAADVDKYGRPRAMASGKEICNNYNAGRCTRYRCPFEHVCSKCHTAGHAANLCMKQPQVQPPISRK